MAPPPIPRNEKERLEELRRLGILDTPPDPAYDDLTLLAAQICGTPIALVSLVDSRRQWFKSRIGVDISETPRDHAFCAHAINDAATMIVEDATADPRFRDNPMVTGPPRVRFYAGVPLGIRAGLNVGTLCVIDREPRSLSDAQKHALEALGRQAARMLTHRRFRYIVETFLGHAPAYVAVKDDAARYVFMNPAWRNAYAEYGDPLGKTSSEWVGDETAREADDRDRNVMENGASELSTIEPFGLPGRKWVVSRFPIETLSGRPGLGVVAMDDTERLAAQSRLRDSERELEHARRVENLGMLASTVAHEFNNVLMGIAPQAEIIKRVSDAGSRQVAAARVIADSVERGRRIVQQILRYGRPADPEFSRLDLSEWIAETLPLLRSIAGESLTINVALPDAPLPVDADGDQLEQVLANLVTNARDAVSGEGTVEIRLQRSGESAHLTFSDSGRGVGPEVLEKIFDPLFTTKRLGTGIGLAVCRHIIERHGGTIAAESGATGTTFHIRMPAAG